MDNTKTLIEISGYALAIFLAIIGLIKAKENWKDKAAVANVTLSIVILTIMISIRYQIIPRIESNQELANNINENPEAFKIAQNYINAKNSTNESYNDLFKESLKELHRQFNYNLDLAINGQFIVSKEDLGAFSYRLIEQTKNTIVATSYVNNKEFWDNPSGEKYEELNYKLAREGKHITRYFIFSHKTEYQNGIERLKKQYQKKIDVYIVFANQLERQETDDVIIIDDIIGGRLKLTPDKGISHAIMYTRKADLEAIYKILENLRAKASRFSVPKK